MNKVIANSIYETIEEMFPDAKCELNHSNALELVIAVMLSAQTTDKSVNKLTDSLFKKYQKLDDYLNVDLKELENDLRTIGLFRNKAKNLQALCLKVKEDYNGQILNDRKMLESLPGVGRKTANVVLSVWFDVPAIAVDTHVERVSKRLKFCAMDASVLDVEQALMKYYDKSKWNKLHHLLIFFGRYHCGAKNPNCKNCLLKKRCCQAKK